MNALIFSLVSLVAAPAASPYWFDAHQLTDGPVNVAPGTYQVWAWLPTHQVGKLTINSQSKTVAAGDKKDQSTYRWTNVGEVPIPDGKASMTLGNGVATVALSTSSDFKPATVSARARVLNVPEAVIDRRGQQARETNTIFTMPEFHSRAEWENYASKLRKQILLTSGLYPLPEKTPLNAEVTDKLTGEGYTIEKVKFEAYPGYFVTGNLYKPAGAGPFPGMVSPHGHWATGRIEDGERGSVPARGITLAKMGIVTFMYDMIGYNDSQQFPHNWGGEAEKLWGVHPFALQLWGSVRVIDFLQSLPEVSPDRIGCTGASGGGTQTFALTAIDPRIKVSAPVNMISSRMQGGCLCENAPILRLANSNMEVGALMAPRPMLMVSATGDWTKETPRVEYPSIRSVFALYDAEERIKNVHVDAGHNYNKTSREAMYRFMGRWLLNEPGWEDYTEPDYALPTKDELRIFSDDTKASSPDAGIIASVIASVQAKWDKELALAESDPKAFAAAHRDAFAQVLGASVPTANDLDCERLRMEERDGYVQENWILGRSKGDDAVPALFFRGVGTKPQDAVILASATGKASFLDPLTGDPGPLVAALIDAGKAVLCIDPFLTGEHHSPFARTERLSIGRFMDTFQPTDLGYRVQDIVTAGAFLRARRDLSDNISVAGLGDAGIWALFASAVDGSFSSTYADFNGFDADSNAEWVEKHYTPCIRSIGDVKTAAALIAPAPLYVAGSDDAGLTAFGAVPVGDSTAGVELAALLK
jgi:dienelactone hydrolase